MLRKEIKRLQAEKSKRMGEYEALIGQEQALCNKLDVKPGEVRVNHMPSEAENVQRSQARDERAQVPNKCAP